ncbi:hypothetical protein BVG81_000515 [Haliangium sp. UPWRP_2]|nr:hypothetical protein BVG81_000515 [Haliangium sp. UPWRP_2]
MAWIEVGGKKRPCIVLDIEGGMAWFIHGTRTKRELAAVCVPAPSPSASCLGLREETFFYAANIGLISAHDVEQDERHKCPPGLFAELCLLLQLKQRAFLAPAERPSPLAEAPASSARGEVRRS